MVGKGLKGMKQAKGTEHGDGESGLLDYVVKEGLPEEVSFKLRTGGPEEAQRGRSGECSRQREQQEKRPQDRCEWLCLKSKKAPSVARGRGEMRSAGPHRVDPAGCDEGRTGGHSKC